MVLDPFMGSGTTLWVAKKLGRRAIGYDISEVYCELALERNRQMALEI
jgi:DNA modification methylase